MESELPCCDRDRNGLVFQKRELELPCCDRDRNGLVFQQRESELPCCDRDRNGLVFQQTPCRNPSHFQFFDFLFNWPERPCIYI